MTPETAAPVAVSGVRRLVTTRRGGVSAPPYDSFNLGAGVGDDRAAVTANRERLAAAAGLPADRIVWMRQVHGATVTTVTLQHSGVGPDPLPDTDGIVTAERGIGLAVLVADCVPILASDPVAGVIAAVHAGRRGSADGIAVRALAEMIMLGAAAERVDVLLGPAICGACYEVPAEMRDEVESAVPGSACTTELGTPGLDLRAGLAAQLHENGVRTVVLDPRCTATDPDLFSHRRGAPTGRLAGLIWLPDPAARISATVPARAGSDP